MRVLYIGNPIDEKMYGANKKYKYTCYADNNIQLHFINDLYLKYKENLEIITINYNNFKKTEFASINNINAICVKYNNLNSILYYFSLMYEMTHEILKAIKNYQSDEIILITNGPYFYYSLIALFIKRKYKNVKIICYLICSIELPQYKGLKKMMLKMSKYFIKKYDGSITYVENSSIDYTNKPYLLLDFQIDNNKVDLSKKYMNSTKGEKIIISYTGALTKVSGVDILLNVINKLPNNYELHICGDGELREKIIYESKKKTSKIKYFGVLNIEDVIKMQCQSDILIVLRPSYNSVDKYYSNYAASCKITEYLLSERPIIVNDHGALNKNLKPYLNIVDNINNIKNFIIKLSNRLNDEKIINKCKNGRKYVISNCVEGKQSKKIYEFINNICK